MMHGRKNIKKHQIEERDNLTCYNFWAITKK